MSSKSLFKSVIFKSGRISRWKMIGLKNVVSVLLILVLFYVADGHARRLHLNRADAPLECVKCTQDGSAKCLEGSILPEPCVEDGETYCYSRVLRKKVSRGCLLDLDEELQDNCLDENIATCTVCQGKGCNNKLFPVGRRSCLQCTGDTCKTALNQTICDLYEQDDKCVTLFDGFKLKSRACQSKLTPEEKPICDGSNAACSVCNTDGCNKETSRSDDTCYVCTQGDAKRECLDLDASLVPTKCEEGNEGKCFTNIVDSKIIRGCGTCEGGNCANCATGNGCNNQKRFPENRLLCRQCSGEECNSEGLTAKTCYLNDPNEKCVTIFDGFKLSRRACKSDLDAEQKAKCTETSVECKQCETDDCNTNSVRDDDTCVECDQTTIENCLDLSTEIPPGLCSVGNEGKCFTTLTDGKMVKRGCYKDLSATEQTACTAPEGKTCKICENGQGCNNEKKFPEDRLTCNQCAGETCNPGLSPQLCSHYEPDDQCVTLFDGFKVSKRTCRSNLDKTMQDHCDTNDRSCITCKGDSCNTDMAPEDDKCIQCTQDGSKCLEELLVAEQCNIPSDGICYKRLLADGKVDRGCISALDEESQKVCQDVENKACEICNSGAGCNNGAFPEDRRNCLQCEASECAEETTSKSCKSYVENDKCATLFNGFKVKKRACHSDLDDEQKLKCNGNNAECAQCNGDGCNTENIRADDTCIECDQATSESCLDLHTNFILPILCNIGNEGKCFTTITDEKMVKRGCYISLNAEEKVTCDSPESKTCEICNEGNGCNKQEKFPHDRLICNECQGETCTLGLNPKLCSKYEQDDQCVTVFDGFEVSRRTCRSSLEKDTQDKCDTNDRSCIMCNEDSCNVDESPEDDRCMQCTQEDPKCVEGQAATSKCAKPSNGVCYKRILPDGAIERGCLSSLVEEQQRICEAEEEASCKICSNGESCNGGTFPENRLNCLQCGNKNCSKEIDSSLCNLYLENDKCVTLFNGFKVETRACHSDLDDEQKLKCDGNSVECVQCDGDGCNTENIRADDTCIECDQGTSESCLDLHPEIVPILCNTGNEGKCFTTITGEKMVKRGCYISLSEEEETTCNAALSKTCEICSEGNGCNKKKKFPDNRLTCNQCEGETCSSELNSAICSIYEPEDQCVTLFDELIVSRRTCRSNLDEESQDKCDNNDKSCIICKGDSCNTATSPDEDKCIQCTQDDPKCVDGMLDPTACALPSERMCYKRVIGGGKIDRGCLSSLDEENQNVCKDEKDQSCIICDKGETCNAGVFPEDRLNCLQCNTEECNGEVASKSCNLYVKNDRCSTLFEGFKPKKQACLSNLIDDEKKKCDANDLECTTCDSNGCNKNNVRKDDKCIECDQANTDNCLELSTPVSAILCTTGNEGKCFTTVTEEKMIKRGCYNNLNQVELDTCNAPESKTCEICNEGNGCNKKEKFPDSRLTCNHCKGETCNPGFDPAICPLYESEDQCVTLFEDKKVSLRTCRSNLDKTVQEKCDNNDRSCALCTGDSCNTETDMNDSCIQCKQGDPKCIEGSSEAMQCEIPNGGMCYKRLWSNGAIDRGCLSSLNEEEQKVCKDANDKTCELCDKGDVCNGGLFPEDRLKCIKCGNENDCDGNGQVPGYCDVYNSKDRCTVLFSGFKVSKKACISSLTAEESTKCIEGSEECFHCGFDDCNRENMRTDDICHSCTQTADENCLNNPSASMKDLCHHKNNGQCFSRVANGFVEKGCSNTLTAAEMNVCKNDENKMCELCTEGKACNKNVFPEGRISCYKCMGPEKECVDKQTDDKTSFCSKYIDEEKCYMDVTMVDDKKHVTRGCVSDVEGHDPCKDKDDKDCYACDKPGCNDRAGGIKIAGSLLLLFVSLFITVKNC